MVYRIGIVGAGFLTRYALVPALMGAQDLRLAAVLDARPEALRDIARSCPDTLLTSSEEEFFATPLDAVHVATPNYLHEHFACRALDRSITTLIDKPLAHTVASGRRIVQAASAAGAVSVVGYMAKHNVYNKEARRLVAAGAIGTPVAMTAARLGYRRLGGDWRRPPSTSGLGCLADLGIYPVLTAVDIFGTEPSRCQASAWPVGDPDETDIYAQATVWFDDHRYLHFEASAAIDLRKAPPGDIDLEQPNTEVCTYTIVGDQGIIQVDDSWQMNGSGSLALCDSAGWRSIGLVPVNPYLSQYRMLAACSSGAEVPQEVSPGRGLTDLMILYAIADNAAAASGATPIDLGSAAIPQPARMG
jgi:predicted dehydrogenase